MPPPSFYGKNMHPLSGPHTSSEISHKLAFALLYKPRNLPAIPDEVLDAIKLTFMTCQLRKHLECVMKSDLRDGSEIWSSGMSIHNKLYLLRRKFGRYPVFWCVKSQRSDEVFDPRNFFRQSNGVDWFGIFNPMRSKMSASTSGLPRMLSKRGTG